MGKIIYLLYWFKNSLLRGLLLKLICRLEGGECYSKTLRRIFKDYHQVEIGMYTHGGCFVPSLFDRFTTVGRYCSIAADVRTFNRNHPMDFKSMHAFFFNPILKHTTKDLVEYTSLTIGNDVWMGHGAIILPQVTYIGDGAVIGAGSVVSKDIPPYAVVVGYPARIVRHRFPREIIDELLASKWWEKDIEEIKPHLKEYQQPYEKLYFNKKNADLQNKQ